MREIKYRAREIKTGKWVYGLPQQGEKSVTPQGGKGQIKYIVAYEPDRALEPFRHPSDLTWYEIDLETVGQYIGLKDCSGKEIYEGDILQIEGATANVVFWGKPPEFGLNFYHNEDKWCEDWNLSDDNERMEVIGNAWEHPELLEVQE